MLRSSPPSSCTPSQMPWPSRAISSGRLWRKLSKALNSGTLVGTPLQRWASARDACSCPSKALKREWVALTATAAPAATFTRSGKVLINMPSARSAPSPACMRPINTVPNTTSSRPDTRPSTCAQARCIRLAALTPNRRACSRTRMASAASRCCSASSISRPSPCTSCTPNGKVGSSTSASMAPKNCSCSATLTPRRAWAT